MREGKGRTVKNRVLLELQTYDVYFFTTHSSPNPVKNVEISLPLFPNAVAWLWQFLGKSLRLNNEVQHFQWAQ